MGGCLFVIFRTWSGKKRGEGVGEVGGWCLRLWVWYSFEAMMSLIPNEERAQLLVSLRETRLRLNRPAGRPPLFPFSPPGNPR